MRLAAMSVEGVGAAPAKAERKAVMPMAKMVERILVVEGSIVFVFKMVY